MRDFDKEREATLAGMSVEDRQFRVRGQFLEGDGPKRWRKLRERDTDPVTYPELQEIMKLAVRVVTGRPLEVPSASSDTPEPTGTFSTVEPRSPALT
jgi:hypothetical protein